MGRAIRRQRGGRGRILPVVVLGVFFVGVAFALWNSGQPRIRVFVVNRSATAATLTFGDGRVAGVPPCSADRYGDDPAARWTLRSGSRELASDTLGAIPSGTVVTTTIAGDGTIDTEVAMAIDTGVLSVRPPDVGSCAPPGP
jgi:hypothetical protein